MDRPVTRRDFVNRTLLGAGGALLAGSSPLDLLASAAHPRERIARRLQDPWTGYGAVGDYARSSGNTRAVMEAAHRIRDGVYDRPPADAVDTGESYDLVVVGGGMSGLGAARFFREHAASGQRCLVLENHPVFGGEAKRNEFVVEGERLVAPQGSNAFGVPAEGSGSLADRLFAELGIPREYGFRPWEGAGPELRFGLDNYAHMTGVRESRVDIAYFFRDGLGPGRWLRNIWENDLRDAPFPEAVRRDLLTWRRTGGRRDEAFRRRLDTMTYAEYIEEVMGLSPEVTRYAEPVVGLINGATPDAVSAFAAHQIGMPGVSPLRDPDGPMTPSFPGGNGALARYVVKDLVPDAIEGGWGFADVLDGSIRFDALDRPSNRVRIRLGATVVRVEHEGPAGSARRVRVTYEKDGRPWTLTARAVVMASGGWVNRHVVRDLPEDIRAAYAHFHHAPALVINVALTNWRFLARMGVTAACWDGAGTGDALGFSCNVRRPMLVGDHRPPLDPDRPTVLTFYMGLYERGRSVQEQGVAGRARLFSTPFRAYERRLREQMMRHFGDAGFDPATDIAGIVLNRWGHARLVQQPGFYYGTGSGPAPREVVERGFGRIAIGHSELNGHQNWTGGMERGARAAEQVMDGL